MPICSLSKNSQSQEPRIFRGRNLLFLKGCVQTVTVYILIFHLCPFEGCAYQVVRPFAFLSLFRGPPCDNKWPEADAPMRDAYLVSVVVKLIKAYSSIMALK